ncbi:hypothetical protein B0J13DRAFT_86044 [Dactylonectria estremocensis]|uniref:Uncharacterized protein n=1 Tax=Dactylonectria estremocensis TaxID=1079267 RepID=A0A9P9IXJ8_9HYPO|nr:hypothetical protein B0J13DRAFT_86044 [Dactylonectria estremocensis]
MDELRDGVAYFMQDAGIFMQSPETWTYFQDSLQNFVNKLESTATRLEEEKQQCRRESESLLHLRRDLEQRSERIDRPGSSLRDLGRALAANVKAPVNDAAQANEEVLVAQMSEAFAPVSSAISQLSVDHQAMINTVEATVRAAFESSRTSVAALQSDLDCSKRAEVVLQGQFEAERVTVALLRRSLVSRQRALDLSEQTAARLQEQLDASRKELEAGRQTESDLRGQLEVARKEIEAERANVAALQTSREPVRTSTVQAEPSNLFKYLNMLGDGSKSLHVVEGEDYEMYEILSELLGSLENPKSTEKLIEFRESGTLDEWFCVLEVHFKGSRAYRPCDPVSFVCGKHGDTECTFIMVTERDSKRELRLLNASKRASDVKSRSSGA